MTYSRHLMHEDGTVLCGQDRRTDPGPATGKPCRKCAAMQKAGGRRPPVKYKWHFYHFNRMPDGRIAGGRLCDIHQVGCTSDVPANLKEVNEDCCKICQRRVRLFDFPLSDAATQRAMQQERLTEIEAGYEKLREILDRCVPGGGMGLAEGEIRFKTIYVNEIRR